MDLRQRRLRALRLRRCQNQPDVLQMLGELRLDAEVVLQHLLALIVHHARVGRAGFQHLRARRPARSRWPGRTRASPRAPPDAAQARDSPPASSARPRRTRPYRRRRRRTSERPARPASNTGRRPPAITVARPRGPRGSIRAPWHPGSRPRRPQASRRTPPSASGSPVVASMMVVPRGELESAEHLRHHVRSRQAEDHRLRLVGDFLRGRCADPAVGDEVVAQHRVARGLKSRRNRGAEQARRR